MSDLLELLKEAVRILEAEEKRKESMLVAELKAGGYFCERWKGVYCLESGIWENKNLFEWISRRRYAV